MQLPQGQRWRPLKVSWPCTCTCILEVVRAPLSSTIKRLTCQVHAVLPCMCHFLQPASEASLALYGAATVADTGL